MTLCGAPQGPVNAITMLPVSFLFAVFNLLLVNRKWWTESKGQKGKASEQGGRRRQDETRAPAEGEGRCSRVARGKGVRKRKRTKGRRMETGREGERCLRGWIRGEEENRKRVIMPQSSLFPVSLDWAPLIGWRGRRGYVYAAAWPSEK